MAKPRVSVITALYCSERYLRATVASVVAQTMPDWELILVDDASPDGTLALAKELAASEPRITVLCHEKNQGSPAFARNTGLEEARGEWVTFLDHDDTFKPAKLERLLTEAEAQKLTFICSNIELVNAETGKVDGLAWGSVSGPVQAGFARRLLQGNFVPPNSTLMYRKAVVDLGGFDTTLKGVDDFDLWYRLARAYPCGVLNEVLATWRYRNAGSISADDTKMLQDEQRFYEKVAAGATEEWERALAEQGVQRTTFRQANQALKAGQYKEAATLYRKAGAPWYAAQASYLGPAFRLAYLLKRRLGDRRQFTPLHLDFTP